MKTASHQASIVGLGDSSATVHELVGGKAANLGKLHQAGFRVPPAFTVSTIGYREFLEHNGLLAIAEAVDSVDLDDVSECARVAEDLRTKIQRAEMPDSLVTRIVAAFQDLGEDAVVAVRSSGVAEDLADASFAGLHDTILNVSGVAALMESIRACWASLWSTRCLMYRHRHQIDHGTAYIAVVIQVMVPSDSAGVMFTANPLTQRTDEIVVNSSWGLGEAVVSGEVSPDELVIDRESRQVKYTNIGSKEMEYVRRTDESGTSTVRREVPQERRDRVSIDVEAVTALANVGESVMRLYGGLPQDVEWALVAGELYLLQARPITGVNFAWDEDVDGWQRGAVPSSTVWSRAYADEFWTGAITPLYYSIKARRITETDHRSFRIWGFKDLRNTRVLKWNRGTAYYNAAVDRLYDQYLFPRSLRGSTLWKLPPEWREDAARAPFSVGKAIKTQTRIFLLDPKRTVFNWFEEIEKFISTNELVDELPSVEHLGTLPDAELQLASKRAVENAARFAGPLRSAIHYYGVGSMNLLRRLFERWSDSEPEEFQDLLIGMPTLTATALEAEDLWTAAEMLRGNVGLRSAFEASDGSDFLDRVEAVGPDGEAFVDFYRTRVLQRHGFRGHADRDYWYPRRSEDPSLGFRTLQAYLATEAESPSRREEALRERRRARTEQVHRSIRSRRFGALKSRLFRRVHDYVLHFQLLRDDERHYMDRLDFVGKAIFLEIGSRLATRGLLARADDVYFLTVDEIDALWQAGAPSDLALEKVRGRRIVFEHHLARSLDLPQYIDNHGNEVSATGGHVQGGATDGFRGSGVSRGTVSGVARVVHNLDEIGRIQEGEILICSSTDPGWAAVFHLIGGLVLETGGMLAHGSCLAREHDIPAVTLPRAMRLVPDGSVVEVDGTNGVVRVREQACSEPSLA